MEKRLRRRTRLRKRRSIWSKISKDLVHRRWFKWAIVFLAFALGSSLSGKSGLVSSAFAGFVSINNAVPEPSSISLLVGGATLFFLACKQRKKN
jgi:hypothetical protein